MIPVLRQKDSYLNRCVRSALGQTVPCEVIVVHGSATPQHTRDTLLQLSKSASLLHVVHEDRPGFAAAINTGIEAATSPRVGFLLSDDWLDPTTVAKCLSHSADIVSTDVRVFDGSGRRELKVRRPLSAAHYGRLERLIDKAAYLTHFFLFTREILAKVGGVDEQVGSTGADDFDLIWTLLEFGASVSIVEEKLYNYRDHKGERLSLRDRDLQIRDLDKILTKHGLSGAEKRLHIEASAHWFGKTVWDAVEDRRTIQQQLTAASNESDGSNPNWQKA